ncbi:hypothetical protein CSING_11075 [Corynebacterium singulare]|uniref:Uncharacterized protein n=1 Tax=Corynebacterium singulare TaxID=161899 RepID=A0A0B6F6S2_9CORY|nr:hypothetical protein CSING_11075 [Corynebacterium singulare]
MIVPYCFLV